MTIEFDPESQNGWDRTFFDLSSKCAEPICKIFELVRFRLFAPLTPGKFDFFENKITEVAYRCLIASGAAFFAMTGKVGLSALATLALSHKVFRLIALMLQKNNYTYVQGNGAEKSLKELDGNIRLASFNLGGICGGMHYDHCGVGSWRTRIDRIVKMIKEDGPDVIALQEVYDHALAEALIDRLKDEYPHFFIQMGANLMGGVGGTMIISRCPIHSFSSTSFKNNSWQLNRTFDVLEIKQDNTSTSPIARIIGTHLIHDDQESRIEQLDQIKGNLAQKQDKIPTIIMGDLNIERTDPIKSKELEEMLIQSNPNNQTTSTKELERQFTKKGVRQKDETIDVIGVIRSELPKGEKLFVDDRLCLENFDQIHAYNAETYDTKMALSDHHYQRADLKLNRS